MGIIKLKRQSSNKNKENSDNDSFNAQDSTKVSQAVKIMAHFKELDKIMKQDNQITSLKIISRAAARVREIESERQPFMDYSVEYHPQITNKNVDKLLYLQTNTLAIKKNVMTNKILHERETLQKMRGACIYIKAKLPTTIEKFKNKSRLDNKDIKSIRDKNYQLESIDVNEKNFKNNESQVNRDRKIEIDITTIHSVLGLSGLELLEDIDTTEITKIRHRLMHVKESIIAKIPEVSADFVIKGLIQFDPNRLIGLVPMLLSVVKYKYTSPNFWASVVHELWLFLITFQHNNLKIGDQSTELRINSLNNSSKKIETNLERNKIFPDYFIAINYLFSGMVDTKIPGVLRLMLRLNLMYYFECRINTLILFCKNPMELWVDSIKISSLLNNIESIRTLLTTLSETPNINIQQISLRIFSSNLTSIILLHLISSPINLVHDRNNSKLIICFIEFLNECLLIGHSKQLLDYVSSDEFVEEHIINSTFGQGYKFYHELDADNIYLDKNKKKFFKNLQDLKTKYSIVGSKNTKTIQSNKKYNLWDIFSMICNPKYDESILYPILLFLADIMYLAFVYEIDWDYSSLKNLLLSIIQLNKHFKKTIMEIGSECSFLPILVEDTKVTKKYLKLLYTGQNIDLKRLQEWITDRRIKESTISRKLDESAKVPCFHPSCNTFTVGSKVRIPNENNENKLKNLKRKGEYDFRYCKGCFVVSYCSEKCQKSHWKLSHSSVCGLMAVPPTSLIFNSTVNWPLTIHLHNTTDKLLETESVAYIQDKYYNHLYQSLSLKVFFDLCALSVPFTLSMQDFNNEPYSCGLRQCDRIDCLKYPGMKEHGLRRINTYQHKQLLIYKELHNDQKLLLQVGDPRIWNVYLKDKKTDQKNKVDEIKRKKIYLTKGKSNIYIPTKCK